MKHDVFPLGDYEHGPADLIAVGNFGVLYRALWKPRGTHVALKQVPRKSEGGRKVEAEERGAMLQAQFGSRHTGIVPEIHEHGRSESGDYYIAMELLDGSALSTYLREEHVTHEHAVRIASWIAGDFLANLHGFHTEDGGDTADMIVYSDLKPDHIFVMRDGSLRALDFGITKRVQQANTSTVNPWASVPYASPRRLREGVVDPDSDFWALGVILYEMIAGHHLYPGLSAEAMSRAIERQDPPAPLPACDPRLAAIIRKLLAPQRHQSYQTAAAIASDLRTLLDNGVPAASSDRISTSVPTLKVGPGREWASAAPRVTVSTDPLPAQAALPVEMMTPPQAAPPGRLKRRRRLRALVTIGIVFMLVSEAAAWMRAEAFRRRIGTIEATGVPDLRAELERIEGMALFGIAVPVRVNRPLTDRLLTLADRPIFDYRTELPIVSKPQWEQARGSLALARELRPGDDRIAARAAYVDAQLTRIGAAGQPAHTERARLDEAVSAFKEAARLDPSLPDPYLGLARIHAYDFKDFDALMDDLRQAQRRGYRESRRERSQMADAYRFRADRARVRARSMEGEERMRLLRESADDYAICAERFEELSNFLDSDRNRSVCEQQHERMRLEIERLMFNAEDYQ
ncbi:MAG: protein kinase [Acidobacteriota bacterium]|nr:protein kinase [Acidobacteriota bacterium]